MSNCNEADTSSIVVRSDLEGDYRVNISSPVSEDFCGFPNLCVALPRLDTKTRYNKDLTPKTPPIDENFKPVISSSPVSEDFRGFPNLCVALPRLDIKTLHKHVTPKTPPIEEDSKPVNSKIKTPKSILKRPTYDKFNAKCSVDIVRDDLEKLKYLVSQTANLNDKVVGSPSMSLKCKICDKVYSSTRKLLNHQRNKHMIIKAKSHKRVSFSDKVTVHELKEYHKCRKCPKFFGNYRALKAHMKVQHKKRKCYICNHCTKKFVDRMFFKVHIKLHCESCGELFTSKTKCMLHKRSVCKILKLHQCKTCDISFFKLMDLKDHSYEHVNNCYVCDICKDQCPTKCGIAHHIYFLHSKRIKWRNPSLYITRKLCSESLYLCKFCDESSVERDLIERHVQLLPDLNNRVMTGYKDYYFCDQCLRKFSTEQDMLQHKWSHFLKTPDNSQTRPSSDVAKKKMGEIKTIYNINEKIPAIFQPTVVLEKLKVAGKVLTEAVEFIDVRSYDINDGDIKKPVVNPKTKKTIISKHQCPNCSKYYSSSYCLNRHIDTQHSDFESLRCKVCEETFVWPSLLQSHKCLRIPIPEMPFDDARPEIHFNNLPEMTNGFDDLNITENDDYMNSVDFEIPAPIVELTEYENRYFNIPSISTLQNEPSNTSINKVDTLPNLGYKLVMQEVPIEF